MMGILRIIFLVFIVVIFLVLNFVVVRSCWIRDVLFLNNGGEFFGIYFLFYRLWYGGKCCEFELEKKVFV